MSLNLAFIKPELSVDDVQSLSAAYGLTLGRNGNIKPQRSHQFVNKEKVLIFKNLFCTLNFNFEKHFQTSDKLGLKILTKNIRL